MDIVLLLLTMLLISFVSFTLSHYIVQKRIAFLAVAILLHIFGGAAPMIMVKEHVFEENLFNILSTAFFGLYMCYQYTRLDKKRD